MGSRQVDTKRAYARRHRHDCWIESRSTGGRSLDKKSREAGKTSRRQSANVLPRPALEVADIFRARNGGARGQ